MKGYFRRSDATAERIGNGWLYTGDVGKVEADGYYYHLGRRDDMIITSGLNVYPAEVEDLIYTYPGVQETIVFAIPDRQARPGDRRRHSAAAGNHGGRKRFPGVSARQSR